MVDIDTLVSTIHNSQKTLFILCGFPYAGKSYIVNKLKSKTDIEVVSIDDIFKTKGFDWDSNILPSSNEWQHIFDESYEKIKIALDKGKNVLHDSTNQTIVSRDTLRKVAASADADSRILHIKTPIETVWKRWEDNQKHQTRSVISRELVQSTIDIFEEPSKSENILTVEN